MEIGAYNNNIQGFVGAQSSQLEKISSALAINKASDDASGLAIAAQLGLEKSSLAQSMENYTSGIAMSNIAQSGLNSQSELLTRMNDLALQADTATTSDDGRQIIADEINKLIEQFDNIAQTTTYNGESLLTTAGDVTDDMSVVGEDSIIDMQKADTLSISDTLKSFMSDFVTNPDSRDSFMEAVNNGIDQLSSFASDFGSAANQLESAGRNTLTMETNTAAAQSTILDADYAKLSSDFNKTNLMTQIAMIVQTQSNAVQNRTVDLLSK